MSERERRIRLEYRAPGSETIAGYPVGLHGGEKVRLLVIKGPAPAHRLVIQACESQGLYPGASAVLLPEGAEFEVWEEP